MSPDDVKRRVRAEVEGLPYEDLVQLDRILHRRKQYINEQVAGRGQPRVDRIVANYERIKAKIKAMPNDPRVPRWKKRLAEYDESLRNWDEFGQETKPVGTPGVEINVPLGRLGIKSNQPQVETD